METITIRPAILAAGTPHVRSEASLGRMTFGRYVVLPTARTLMRAGRPVGLGARAFDLLVVLLASRGEVVGKEAIFRHVWPTTTVDESNLRFQMTLLRKALGRDRDLIKTIPGRGYLFAAEPDEGTPPAELMPMARADADCVAAPPRAVSEALRALLSTFRRYPDALASLEGLLASGAEDGRFAIVGDTSLPRMPAASAMGFTDARAY